MTSRLTHLLRISRNQGSFGYSIQHIETLRRDLVPNIRVPHREVLLSACREGLLRYRVINYLKMQNV